MGFHRAGFEVVGVDINPQPEYPFLLLKMDAITALDLMIHFPKNAEGYDLIWASPPCQHYSTATRERSKYPDLVPVVREKLKQIGKPYIIENVVGAPLRNPIMLCGTMFGLRVLRHRLFECSFPARQPQHHPHKGSLVTGEYITVAGNGGMPKWTTNERAKRGLPRHIPGEMHLKTWQDAMGIDWMKRKTLTQAIPPAYSTFLATEFVRWKELSREG